MRGSLGARRAGARGLAQGAVGDRPGRRGGGATFGLLAVIWGVSRHRATAVPVAVGAYITAAFWFTSSTSFANPAVSLARAATDTFAGIRPVDVPAFVVAQLVGALAATFLFRWLTPALPERAADVVVPHRSEET